MIIYYCKSAFHALRGSMRFTILNMLSLSLGLSLVVMMVMLINYELSYDSFHPNRDEILQVIQHDLKSDELSTSCPLPLPSVLLEEFPEVEHATGISKMISPNAAISWNDREYSGFTGASVDKDFLTIFGYELLAVNRDDILEAPDQILVSERFARTVFGDEEPLGQVVSLRDHPLTVSGIFMDVHDNSSVKFDLLLSEKARAFIRSDYKTAWWNGGMQTYVILQSTSMTDAFETHLQEIPARHYPDFLKGRSTFMTRPFKGSHFDTSVLDYDSPPIPRSYLFILASITFITLLIACINYINLSTAQSVRRNIDSGIRQIMGARSGQIIRLHVWIAFLVVIGGLAIALTICILAMPLIESLTQRPVGGQFSDPVVWIILAATVLVTGLITGYLPGRSFVRVEPVQLVRTKGSTGTRTRSYRDGMIIFQFTLTITLIIVQLFIFKQVSYMKNADLGFDNENLLAIHVNGIDDSDGKAYSQVGLFKEEVEQYMAQYGFSRGTVTENIPGYYYQNSFVLVPTDAVIDECLVVSTAVDEYFHEVYGMEMVEGRYFSPEYSTDQTAFIINETAFEMLGWESIDGKFMKYHHEGQAFPVVGVMKDIHTTTLREPMKPMVYRFGDHNNFPGFLTFRISPEQGKETIAFFEAHWQEMFEELPFNHFNVRERYYENYEEEKRFSRIIGSFTMIAILLSMLGLFGLVSFLAEQRHKEIGIRKVNGAGSGEILLMMNRIFLKWVGIAFLLSCPIAWYAVRAWLQEFAYRTSINPVVFLVAGLLAMIITLITVSWQSWRAAARNPVDSLRYE